MPRYPNFTILIPTRNRPSQITNLLESLLVSTLKPFQIIIVASGEDIGSLVRNFAGKLPITYLYTNIGGQVSQKKEGLNLLADESEWVVFLDDDLLVSPDTFETAFSTVLELTKKNINPILGIGLKIRSTSRVQNLSKLSKVLSRIFILSSNKPGSILKSGQAVTYLDQSESICTEWLNGASIWRKASAISYRDLSSSSKYAAYEDVMFSYPQSKKGNLIFSPNSILIFQDNDLTNFEAREVYKTAAYLRMSFVLDNSELSPMLCAWSQVGRSLFAAKQIGFRNLNYLFFLSKINWRLFLVAINNRQIQTLLTEIST